MKTPQEQSHASILLRMHSFFSAFPLVSKGMGKGQFCRERVEREYVGGQGWWKSTVINKGRKGPEGGGEHYREILWTPQICHPCPLGQSLSCGHRNVCFS